MRKAGFYHSSACRNYWFSLSDLSDKRNTISLKAEPEEEYHFSVCLLGPVQEEGIISG